MKLSWWEAKEDAEIHPGQRGSRYVGFLRELMPLMVSAGLGEVCELRTPDEVVGVEVSLLDGRNFYSWQGGYDLEVAHLGPGKVAIGEGIRTSIAAGRRYYDLMRGADTYKYWYGCRDRESRSLLIGNGRLTSRAALFAIGPYERLRGSSGTDSPDGGGLAGRRAVVRPRRARRPRNRRVPHVRRAAGSASGHLMTNDPAPAASGVSVVAEAPLRGGRQVALEPAVGDPDRVGASDGRGPP